MTLLRIVVLYDGVTDGYCLVDATLIAVFMYFLELHVYWCLTFLLGKWICDFLFIAFHYLLFWCDLRLVHRILTKLNKYQRDSAFW